MKGSLLLRSAVIALASIALGSGFVLNAQADDVSDALSMLQTAVRKELSAKPNPDPNPEERGPEWALNLTEQIRMSIDQNNYANVEETLNQLPVYFKSSDILNAVDKLSKAVAVKKDALEKAASAEIESALKSCADTVRSATKPADLDQCIDSLSELMEKYQNQPSFNGRFGGRGDRGSNIMNTRQFVLNWQDYLAYKQAGNLEQARQTLQSIRNEVDLDIIPRSEILAKIADFAGPTPSPSTPSRSPEESLHALLSKTTRLDEIPAAQKEIATLLPPPNYALNNPFQGAKRELDDLQQAYTNFKEGLPAELPLRNDLSPPIFNETLPLTQEFLRLAAPQFLGVEDKLNANESLPEYLDRMMSHAQEIANGELILRVRDLQDALNSKQLTATEQSSMTALRAAQNQEAAGQFELAVISYETALATAGDLTPTAAVGSHLAKIRKDHPDDYSKGVDAYLAHPAQPVTNYNSGSQPRPSIIIPGFLISKPASSPLPPKSP